MSNLINYEGFKIPQPTPANLGGEALANNFKWLSMTSTSHAYNDTLPVVGFTTQYDLSGNKMFERGLHAETRSSLYQPFDEKGYAQGGYDSVDRLRKALRGELSSDGGYTATGGGSITTLISLPTTDTSRNYDLDGLGNWEQSNYIPVGGTATIDLRQHNKLNEITSRKTSDDTKVLFAYDGTTGASNGNLADDGTLELSYDALNRLIQVKRKSDGATIGQYVYDALNRRISKTISNGGLTGDVPNGSTTFLYQDWQVVEELNSSSSTIKQYVWGQYIDECIQIKTLTTTDPQSLPAGDYYPLQDLLYRTMALTNDEGNIVEAYDYDAYGNTLIFRAAGTENNWWADDATQTNYGACEVLFCGYRYDPESKLYQVRNREYYPALERWLQRDPIGFDGGDWNLYGYVKNQPLTLSDSFGLLVASPGPPPGTVATYDILADAQAAVNSYLLRGLVARIAMFAGVFAIVLLDAKPTAGPESDEYRPTPTTTSQPCPPPCDDAEYTGLTKLIHAMCDKGISCKSKNGRDLECPELLQNRRTLQKCRDARKYRDERCKNLDPKPEKHEIARTNNQNAINICNDKIRIKKCEG